MEDAGLYRWFRELGFVEWVDGWQITDDGKRALDLLQRVELKRGALDNLLREDERLTERPEGGS